MRHLLIVLLFLFCGCLNPTHNYNGKEWEESYYLSKNCDTDIMETEIACYEVVGLRRLLTRTPIP